MKPKKVQDVMVAFPATLGDMLPKWDEIPAEFKHGHTKWNNLAGEWFFSGLQGHFVPKEGIELADAMRHLKCIMGSYEPKHEHKEAGAAYLMSLWFDDFVHAKKKP